MHLTALNIHPVKSLRGVSVEVLEIDALGAVGDRRFLIVDALGDPLTQRNLPRMATIAASLAKDTLTLRSAGSGEIEVRRNPDDQARVLQVNVWSSKGLLAEDCGEASAVWLSQHLGTPCRLVRIGPDFNRPVLKKGAEGDVHGFADSYPFLIISEASLEDLNTKIAHGGGERIGMERFRTNLVVSGCDAFAEDSWKRIRIGGMIFRTAGPCDRCTMTTTDQATGARGHEPLKTLATYRRDAVKPTLLNFGQNLVHELKAGAIRVGDRVEVLE